MQDSLKSHHHYVCSIPEVLFLGTDEIMKMDDESIEEVAWTMIIFFISVILERTVHILMEVSIIIIIHYYF